MRLVVLYGSSDKPIWLSKQGMLKRIGLFSKYRPAPQRFPLTTEVLNRNVETREEFIFRRLNWAIGIFALNNETITIEKLRHVAWFDPLTLKAHSQLIYELSQKHGVAVRSKYFLPM